MAIYKTSRLLQKTSIQFLVLTLTTVQNSTFRGSSALFWPPAAAAAAYGVHTCRQNTHAHKKILKAYLKIKELSFILVLYAKRIYTMSPDKAAPQSHGLELISAWDVDRPMVVAQLPMAPRLLALAMPLAFREWKSQYCSLSLEKGEQSGAGIQC